MADKVLPLLSHITCLISEGTGEAEGSKEWEVGSKTLDEIGMDNFTLNDQHYLI